ncbi:hypothetical protein BOTBODRAFT_172809 [Botryobasidium botryosum FD-172 SS1]|uniref:HAT C-terminal dimerisation domain-containing protein n=1 Tax=Botryobasidium botryosum (strain FD-172 SS1) TaxID=930990 RepID=A0A067MYS3_BOTB1|nr:hypothetical protein BOTBODRAFT_172809 [Botryobasidium botryosum FD-172 SS1]
MIDQLLPLLNGFLDATKMMSQANTPLVSEVIPLIDDLHVWLKDVAATETNHQAVRHATQCGIAALNKYYSLTDKSSVAYTVFHPAYKTDYMVAQEWPASWIAEVLSHVHGLVRCMEGCIRASFGVAPPPEQSQKGTLLTSQLNRFKTQMCTATTSEALDQLETYLTQDSFDCDEPLAWWSTKRSAWPELLQMAINYLSIPATSVDVERAFSYGRRTVSLYRHSLSSETIHTCIVFGNRTTEGLINDDELVAMLKEKASWGGETAKGHGQ